MPEALYHQQDQCYSPTSVAGSPWHPSLLHGGAVSALFGQLISEQAARWPDFRLNRVSMDLWRPVPMQALHATATVLRDGQRLKLIELLICADQRPVARAQALLQRAVAVTLPDYAPRPAPSPPGPAGCDAFSIQAMLDAKGVSIPEGFHTRVEVREVTPWQERGAACGWLRVPVEVVAGVPLNPISQACMIADLGNGTGQLNLGQSVGCINADIVLSLFTYPRSEWLCLRSEAMLSADGVGAVYSDLFDEQGAIGRIMQSIQTNGEFDG